MAAFHRASWRNPRVLSVLLLVFLSGAICGALAMRFSAQYSIVRLGPYWKEGGKEISLQKFKRELNLSPAQTEEVETVLDDFVMYYQTLQSQMDEVRASGKDRILLILDSQQRLKFEKMMHDLQSKQIR
ncbi:MAG: hypothetical protein ACK5AZ_26390 [Bryobacteraceae bacterium]